MLSKRNAFAFSDNRPTSGRLSSPHRLLSYLEEGQAWLLPLRHLPPGAARKVNHSPSYYEDELLTDSMTRGLSCCLILILTVIGTMTIISLAVIGAVVGTIGAIILAPVIIHVALGIIGFGSVGVVAG